MRFGSESKSVRQHATKAGVIVPGTNDCVCPHCTRRPSTTAIQSIRCLSQLRSYVKEIGWRNRYNIHRCATTIAHFNAELVLLFIMSSSLWVMFFFFWINRSESFKRNERSLTSRSFQMRNCCRVLSKPASTANQLFCVQSFIATRNQC